MKLRALTTTVEVEIDDDVELRDLALAVAGLHPPAIGPAERHLHVRRDRLVRDQEPADAEPPEDVVPHFEFDLHRGAMDRAPVGWLLHAAAIDVGGRALVLCGRSGAGKTTASLTLAARGLPMLSDELIWIAPDGLVHGLRRLLHRKPGDGLPIPPSWQSIQYDLRLRSGEIQRQSVVAPPQAVFAPEPLPLHTIVRLGHGPDWPAYLRQSPHSTALQRLWDQTIRYDEADLAVAANLLRDRVTYELSSTTAEQALTLLEPLLK